MNSAAPVTVLAVTIAIAVVTLPRHPRVLAWRKRRREEQILARAVHPSSGLQARFYAGAVPHHEDCAVLPREEDAFTSVAGELDYAWVTQALLGGQKGREQ